MTYVRLTVVLIIGVLQVYTANAIASEEEGDPAKLFSADELQRAENVGLSSKRLVEGKSFGFTFDEMMKFHEIREDFIKSQGMTTELMGKLCTILDPEHKTATAFTSAQETALLSLLDATSFLFVKDRAPFARSIFCGYVSQPDRLDMEANAFGVQLTPYALIRYLKMKVQKASGAERVQLAKEMCCAYKHQHKNLKIQLYSGLADEEIKEFGERWDGFETANTLQSLNHVCEFLHSKSPTGECTIDVPVDAGHE